MTSVLSVWKASAMAIIGKKRMKLLKTTFTIISIQNLLVEITKLRVDRTSLLPMTQKKEKSHHMIFYSNI